MADGVRERFLYWQCRLRQIAMREDGGRPSPGMQPRLLDSFGAEIAPALTVLLVPDEPEESTAFFRFQVQKSADPRDVYERGLAFLRADHFQEPGSFSGRLAAVLPAIRLLRGSCWRPARRCWRSTSGGSGLSCRVASPRPGKVTRFAKRRSGTTASSIPCCPTACMSSPSGPTGRRRPPTRSLLRTSGMRGSDPKADASRKSGSGRAARAPACRDPAGCPAASSSSAGAPSR
jgi:hypothetical protein